MKRRISLLLLALALVLSSCSIGGSIFNQDKKTTEVTVGGDEYVEKEKTPEAPKEDQEEKTATIKVLGDVFMHGAQLDYAKSKGKDGSYDFTDNFARIKDYIQDADLAILNNEFSSRSDWQASSYPTFNTPETIYDALKDAGIDALTNANNHAIDTGIDGLEKTLENIDERGLYHTGTYKRNTEHEYLIMDANGIKVGLLSYAEMLNGLEPLLNTPEKKAVVNMLDPEKIKADIEGIKAAGADFIIVYPHWGNEYQGYPTDAQIKLGRQMVDWGADFVIGNHPHVVQPKETYTTADGRTGYIYYALGNVISNQRLETIGDIRSEQGASVEIKISLKGKASEGGEKKAELIDHPICVTNFNDGPLPLTQVLLPAEYLAGGSKEGELKGDRLARFEKAVNMVTKTLNTKVKLSTEN